MPTSDKEKNREYQRRWYQNNKAKAQERNRIISARYRDEVREYKESNPCVDCGNKFHFSAMDFDHVNDDKHKGVAILVNQGSRKQIWEEIEKCELVCSNCHRVRTFNRK